MEILVPEVWNDYELRDSGSGRRLERFGKVSVSRPDPQAIWLPSLPVSEWEKADSTYTTRWEGKHLDRWKVSYKDLSFYARLTPFKHTGIFPEQAVNWDWMREKLHRAKRKGQSEIRVLNLFGYTGIATLACAAEGAKVTHVDASKPSIGWARENQEASGLTDKPIRWILDDAVKFVEREVRRGSKYEGILMDPPIYGHGPTGEKWDFFEGFPKLLEMCTSLLSENALFLLVNAYAISASAVMLENLLQDNLGKRTGTIESGELALQEKASQRLLSTGIFGRWSSS